VNIAGCLGVSVDRRDRYSAAIEGLDRFGTSALSQPIPKQRIAGVSIGGAARSRGEVRIVGKFRTPDGASQDLPMRVEQDTGHHRPVLAVEEIDGGCEAKLV